MPKAHRWFAAFYDAGLRCVAPALDPMRRLTAGGAGGRVLEIGAGTGANFPFYDWTAVTTLVACEPDPFMLQRAREKAAILPPGAHVELTEAPAERLPFETASFDTVVSTLVLCTVDSPGRSLAEVVRVLKPDGTLRLLEHVRAGGFAGRCQDAGQPVWGWLAGGCHWNRPTEASIIDAGFSLEVLSRRAFGPAFPVFAAIARLR